MIYQWFLVAGLAALAIALIVAAIKADDGFGFGMTAAVIIFITICISVVIPIQQIDHQKDMDAFLQQKAYFESHVAKNEIEDAAITQKKIDLNSWLYKAQFSAKKWGEWSLVPREVLEVTPIE